MADLDRKHFDHIPLNFDVTFELSNHRQHCQHLLTLLTQWHLHTAFYKPFCLCSETHSWFLFWWWGPTLLCALSCFRSVFGWALASVLLNQVSCKINTGQSRRLLLELQEVFLSCRFKMRRPSGVESDGSFSEGCRRDRGCLWIPPMAGQLFTLFFHIFCSATIVMFLLICRSSWRDLSLFACSTLIVITTPARSPLVLFTTNVPLLLLVLIVLSSVSEKVYSHCDSVNKAPTEWWPFYYFTQSPQLYIWFVLQGLFKCKNKNLSFKVTEEKTEMSVFHSPVHTTVVVTMANSACRGGRAQAVNPATGAQPALPVEPQLSQLDMCRSFETKVYVFTPASLLECM